MGTKESKAELDEQHYRENSTQQLFFFGLLTKLLHRTTHQLLFRKTIVFDNAGDLQSFLESYSKIEVLPFSVIYPSHIMTSYDKYSCSSVFEAAVYFDNPSRTLQNVVAHEGTLSEPRIWFLLNELTHSLDLLHQQQRPHWGLRKDTIFINQNDNWLIHDSLFVLGLNYQSFLLSEKWGKDTPISPELNSQLNDGLRVDLAQGYNEDIYCLGYALIYAMTGMAVPNARRSISHQSSELLARLVSRYSSQLLSLVEKMIMEEESDRISLNHLRKLLKEKEKEIIHNDTGHLIKSAQGARWEKSNAPPLIGRRIRLGREVASNVESQSRLPWGSPKVSPNSLQMLQAPSSTQFIRQAPVRIVSRSALTDSLKKRSRQRTELARVRSFEFPKINLQR